MYWYTVLCKILGYLPNEYEEYDFDIILSLSLLLKKVKHHKYVSPKNIITIIVRLLLCSDHY